MCTACFKVTVMAQHKRIFAAIDDRDEAAARDEQITRRERDT
jgi:DNA-binding FadR family transcriptional regulator